MSTKQCPQCGLVNFQHAAYCGRCGHSLASSENGFVKFVKQYPSLGLLAAFITVFFLYAFITKPRPTSAPTLTNSAAIAPASSSSAPQVTFEPESVTLNYRTRQMEITGTLRNASPTRPERVWVWAYFFNPSFSDGSWSDQAIEIENPFRSGDTARITARGHFHWWNNSYTPTSGYFARTSVSVASGEGAHIHSSVRNKTTPGALTVRVVR